MNDKNNRDSQLTGRRRALIMIGGGVAAAGLFIACKKDEGGSSGATGTGSAAATGAGGCDTPPDETSKGIRKTLQYKKEATDAAKQCKDCAQYTAGAFGECGGCKLFTGPVKPGGGCLSFAPKGGDGGKAG